MTSGERIDNSQPDSQRGAIAQPLWQGLASEAVLWSLRAGSWLHRLDGAATMPTAGEPAEAHGSQAVPCAWGGHISWSPACGMRRGPTARGQLVLSGAYATGSPAYVRGHRAARSGLLLRRSRWPRLPPGLFVPIHLRTVGCKPNSVEIDR